MKDDKRSGKHDLEYAIGIIYRIRMKTPYEDLPKGIAEDLMQAEKALVRLRKWFGR